MGIWTCAKQHAKSAAMLRPANKHSASNFLGLILPMATAALACGGYYAYWARAAAQIEDGVRAALAQTGTRVSVTGFPYRLTLALDDIALAATGGSKLQAARLVATASPFDPSLWVLSGVSDVRLVGEDGAVTELSPKNLQASLRLSSVGIARLSVLMDGVMGSSNWALGKTAFHLVGDPKDKDRLALVADVSNIKIPVELDGPAAILGTRIDHFRIAGPISHAQALMQSGAKAWQAQGGTLSIMSAHVAWGPVDLRDATGSLLLSPEGTWTARISGTGALKPEGIPVPALTAPVTVEWTEGKLSVLGINVMGQ
jgi:hypothetical protein